MYIDWRNHRLGLLCKLYVASVFTVHSRLSLLQCGGVATEPSTHSSQFIIVSVDSQPFGGGLRFLLVPHSPSCYRLTTQKAKSPSVLVQYLGAALHARKLQATSQELRFSHAPDW